MRCFANPIFFAIILTASVQSKISAQVSVNRIIPVWGLDLTMRLDTLTGRTTDSIRTTHHAYRIVTGSNYDWSFYPAECQGILVFTDSTGNVQNFAVKRYEFEFFNGNIMRTGFNNNRQIYQAIHVLEHHKIGDYITITRVELLDLSGRPMTIKVPQFRIVKVR